MITALDLQREVIDLSYRFGWGHIPSALSMVNYLHVIKPVVDKHDVWIIGKPYGEQAYYVAFDAMPKDPTIRGIRTGTVIGKRVVDYADITFGDCLGVAAGYALVNPKSKIWVNVSDTAFDVGKVIEACQFIASNRLNNIFLTIDCNKFSVNNKTDRFDYICKFLNSIGWDVQTYKGNLKKMTHFTVINKPRAIIFGTVKGAGFPFMIKNPREWHYKTIDDDLYYKLINEGDDEQ